MPTSSTEKTHYSSCITYTNSEKLLAEESHKLVSIIFQPGGLNRFLNIPMTELFDNGYSARKIIGKEIEELLDKSHDMISFDELDEIIQSYFLSKLSKVKKPYPFFWFCNTCS